MNYLAHGYKYLDRPLFLAGTAVPDWLSVVDRKVRARVRLVKPVIDDTECESTREIGLGILQHHSDDDTFHRCELFMQLESELSLHFREQMPDPFDHRPGFLGHIVVELMLDAHLASADDSLLDKYYAVLADVAENTIQEAVNKMATRTTDRLGWFINRFREERFLYDYMDNQKLLLRLNQVLKRVRLPPMSTDAIDILIHARELLNTYGSRLLKVVENAA